MSLNSHRLIQGANQTGNFLKHVSMLGGFVAVIVDAPMKVDPR